MSQTKIHKNVAFNFWHNVETNLLTASLRKLGQTVKAINSMVLTVSYSHCAACG